MHRSTIDRCSTGKKVPIGPVSIGNVFSSHCGSTGDCVGNKLRNLAPVVDRTIVTTHAPGCRQKQIRVLAYLLEYHS